MTRRKGEHNKPWGKKPRPPGRNRPSRPPERVSEDRGIDPSFLFVSECLITPEPVRPPDAPPYNEQAQNEYQRLVALSKEDPERAISEIEEARARYPEQRQFFTALTMAHLYVGHHDEAYRVAEETYRRFPNYLFAKVNYASLCLERGEIHEVAEILEGKFALKLLYPERDVFHISEFVGFTALMGRYFVAIGEIKSAFAAYKVLAEMVPEAEQTLDLEERINRAVASAKHPPFPPMAP